LHVLCQNSSQGPLAFGSWTMHQNYIWRYNRTLVFTSNMIFIEEFNELCLWSWVVISLIWSDLYSSMRNYRLSSKIINKRGVTMLNLDRICIVTMASGYFQRHGSTQQITALNTSRTVSRSILMKRDLSSIQYQLIYLRNLSREILNL
jgi:hypothetical protein